MYKASLKKKIKTKNYLSICMAILSISLQLNSSNISFAILFENDGNALC